jgi:hypothetical protein
MPSPVVKRIFNKLRNIVPRDHQTVQWSIFAPGGLLVRHLLLNWQRVLSGSVRNVSRFDYHGRGARYRGLALPDQT